MKAIGKTNTYKNSVISIVLHSTQQSMPSVIIVVWNSI